MRAKRTNFCRFLQSIVEDDIFCQIIKRKEKNGVIMEGEGWVAINDIHPQAPVHVLILPKKHFKDLSEIKEADVELVGQLMLAAEKVAKKLGLEERGYRLIVNKGEHGGQLVPHFHIHLLGGRKMGLKIVHDPK